MCAENNRSETTSLSLANLSPGLGLHIPHGHGILPGRPLANTKGEAFNQHEAFLKRNMSTPHL